MRNPEKVVFMNMCMVYDDNKVLVIDRQKKDWPGITFPGGHVELGESFTDSVIREIKEETNLAIQNPMLCGIKDWSDDNIRYVLLFYKTNKFSGEIVSSEEGEVWWETLDNLQNLKLALDMKDMLRVFLEDDLSEFYYYKKDNIWVYDLK
jgi:8-oxo-dGTP diphosphatase